MDRYLAYLSPKSQNYTRGYLSVACLQSVVHRNLFCAKVSCDPMSSYCRFRFTRHRDKEVVSGYALACSFVPNHMYTHQENCFSTNHRYWLIIVLKLINN